MASKRSKKGRPKLPEPAPRLTPREKQILQLLAEGNSSNEIADVIGITIPTVETHRRHLRDKLNLTLPPGWSLMLPGKLLKRRN